MRIDIIFLDSVRSNPHFFSLFLLFFLTLVLYLDMILFYNYRTLFILAISRAMINNCTVFIDKSIDNLENLQLL